MDGAPAKQRATLATVAAAAGVSEWVTPMSTTRPGEGKVATVTSSTVTLA